MRLHREGWLIPGFPDQSIKFLKRYQRRNRHASHEPNTNYYHNANQRWRQCVWHGVRLKQSQIQLDAYEPLMSGFSVFGGKDGGV